MRFCTHCGAQVPDNAKFCPACGNSIYAPDKATVTISDTVETTVSASAETGEFVAASWSPSVPQKTPEPPQPNYDSTPRNRKTAKDRNERSGKRKGFFHYVWLLVKVIIFAILAIFLIFFIIGFIQGYTS